MKTIKRLIPYLLFCVTALTAISQETQYIKVVNFRVDDAIDVTTMQNLAQEYSYMGRSVYGPHYRRTASWALLIIESNENEKNLNFTTGKRSDYIEKFKQDSEEWWENGAWRQPSQAERDRVRTRMKESKQAGEKWASIVPGVFTRIKVVTKGEHPKKFKDYVPEIRNGKGDIIGYIEDGYFIPDKSIATRFEEGKVYRLTIEVPQDYSSSVVEPDKPVTPGFVTFVTDPVGAVVTLLQNGETKTSGKTNPDYSFSLEYGEYMYVVSAENHQSASGMVRISETPATKSVKLRPICGKLTVMSSPSGAEVTIGGVKYGVTPLNIDSIIIGEHEVTISKAGYGEIKETVKITETDRAMINAQLSGSENLKPSLSTLTPKWAPEVTDEQKRILTELINSMVYVEGGTFWMGAQSTDSIGLNYDVYAEKNESPVHSVKLNSFYIGKYEVRQCEWYAVMGKNPAKNKGGNNPIENVRWEHCQEFISKLHKMTGLNFSFPSEAQWEFAALGGNKSKGYRYSGSNNYDDVGIFATHPVGLKAPNELGLYDMSGNVLEWCYDLFGEYPDSHQINPIKPGKIKRVYFRHRHVIRGFWGRLKYRINYIPYDHSEQLGLRLVIDI